MKRSKTLQPLSREHHAALTLAKACERAAESGAEDQIAAACERVIRAFADDLEPHFIVEEQSLLPLLETAGSHALVQRTLEDHLRLRTLLGELQRNDAEALRRFGEGLFAHVRFEERELFPALEDAMGED